MKIVRPKINKNSGDNFDRLLAQESLILEVTEEICRLLEAAKITRQELAHRLGKSKGFITQVLSGERNMTLRTAADLAGALDHRLQVRAVPNIRTSSIGVTPAYFRASSMYGPLQGRTGLATPLSSLASEWNEFARRAVEARSKDPFTAQERWAPATKPVECEDLEEAKVHDHEFSLSA